MKILVIALTLILPYVTQASCGITAPNDSSTNIIRNMAKASSNIADLFEGKSKNIEKRKKTQNMINAAGKLQNKYQFDLVKMKNDNTDIEISKGIKTLETVYQKVVKKLQPGSEPTLKEISKLILDYTKPKRKNAFCKKDKVRNLSFLIKKLVKDY